MSKVVVLNSPNGGKVVISASAYKNPKNKKNILASGFYTDKEGVTVKKVSQVLLRKGNGPVIHVSLNAFERKENEGRYMAYTQLTEEQTLAYYGMEKENKADLAAKEAAETK